MGNKQKQKWIGPQKQIEEIWVPFRKNQPSTDAGSVRILK